VTSTVPERTVYFAHGGKVARILVCAAAFVVAGVAMLVWVPVRLLPFALVKIAGVASVAFFGGCGIYAVVRLLGSRPLLVLDDFGIDDHATAGAVGRVSWDEIESARIDSMMGQRFLVVTLRDPTSVIERLPRVTRAVARMNQRLTGSPFNIGEGFLPVRLEVVLANVEQRLAARRFA
jgi:hypothetical protein